MTKSKSIIEYSSFTFEDFLNDDYFIFTISNPTNPSDNFWRDFRKSQPANIEEFNLAVSFLELSGERFDYLSQAEVSSLWYKISKNKNTSKKKIERHYFIAITVAASILFIIMFSLNNYFNAKTHASDLISYVNGLPEISYTDQTQLVIADNKVLGMDGKETTVNYETSLVKTQNEEISKSDISQYNQLITPKGKRSVLTLHDGTKVWINVGTRVVYPKEFSNKNREIYVEGEVFIDVTKDENRPFIVRTSKMNLRVLGTTFNLSAYSNETVHTVALVSGSIQVEINQENKVVLKPNQLLASAGEKYTVKDADVSSYMLWKDGIYKFNGAKLSVVFERLSKFYGKEIICNIDLKDLKCSGYLDLKNDIGTVLENLSFIIPFDVKYENQKYIIVKSSK